MAIEAVDGDDLLPTQGDRNVLGAMGFALNFVEDFCIFANGRWNSLQ
jgi:hypothetical protein